MPWFQCEDCGDTLKKPKVKGHASGCSASRFSCVDCLQVFDRWSVQQHTSCVTEHEKYALSITKPGQEHLMHASAAASGGGGGGGAGGGGNGGGVVGESFLATKPPWDCACCGVKCTSQETLLGHAAGKKHRSKARGALAKQGLGLDGKPLPVEGGDDGAGKGGGGGGGEAEEEKEVRLLPIRPRSRGARRSLRTFPVVTLHPRFPFNA